MGTGSPYRPAAALAGIALAVAAAPVWLTFRRGLNLGFLLAVVLSCVRGLLALTAIWLVLVNRHLGAVLGLFASAELLLAAAAVPPLLTASENRT